MEAVEFVCEDELTGGGQENPLFELTMLSGRFPFVNSNVDLVTESTSPCQSLSCMPLFSPRKILSQISFRRRVPFDTQRKPSSSLSSFLESSLRCVN